MKKYIKSSTSPEQLSKERLEGIVNSILTTVSSEDFSNAEKLRRIEIVLTYFGLMNKL
jgi:hypothetical protein